MTRRVKIWTWDRGNRAVDMDGSPGLLVPILETVLEGGLWEEFERFPVDTVERLLPLLTLPRNIRRLVEIWIEQRQVATTGAKRVATSRSHDRLGN